MLEPTEKVKEMPVKLFPPLPGAFQKLPFAYRCMLLETCGSYKEVAQIKPDVLALCLESGLFEEEVDAGEKLLICSDKGKEVVSEVLATFKPLWATRLKQTIERIREARQAKFLSVKQKAVVVKEFHDTLEKFLVRQWNTDFNGSKKVMPKGVDSPAELEGLSAKARWILGVIAGAEEVPAAYFRKYNGVKDAMELSRRKLIKIMGVKEPKYVLTELGLEITGLCYVDPDGTEEEDAEEAED